MHYRSGYRRALEVAWCLTLGLMLMLEHEDRSFTVLEAEVEVALAMAPANDQSTYAHLSERLWPSAQPDWANMLARIRAIPRTYMVRGSRNGMCMSQGIMSALWTACSANCGVARGATLAKK